MIIWSGWGILVILFGAVGIFVGAMVGSVAGALVGGAFGGAAAAALNMMVAKALDKPKVVMNPQTGQPEMHVKSNSLFFIPMRFFTYIFPVVGLGLGVLFFAAGQHEKHLDAKYPGKKLFDAASDTINSSASTAYHGNTEQAQKAAQAYGESMSTMQSMLFEDEDGGAVKAGTFRTHCHRGEECVVFLCHVPDLKSYQDQQAKDALVEMAWANGKAVAAKMEGVDDETPMYVGLRGFASYGFVMKGKAGGELTLCGDDKVDLYLAFDPTVVGAD